MARPARAAQLLDNNSNVVNSLDATLKGEEVKRYFRHFGLFVGVTLLALAGPSAWSQDCPCNAPPGAYDDPVSLQPDLLPDFPVGDEMEYGIGNHVAACSGPFCGHACRSEGIYFSVESYFVDVHQSESDAIAPRLLEIRSVSTPNPGNLDPDPDPTARFMFGYQTCDGLGVQARYWEFDTATSVSLEQPDPLEDPNFLAQGWDVSVLDVEVVKNTMVNQFWDTSLSGGYRFARYEEGASLRRNEVVNNMLIQTEQASMHTRYIGNGLTGAAGVRRQCTRCLSAMANVRSSLLFGNQTIKAEGVTLPPTVVGSTFDSRYTMESQVGAAYEHGLCGGGFWYVKGGYEIQYWNDFLVPFGAQVEPKSTLFHGFIFAVGLQR